MISLLKSLWAPEDINLYVRVETALRKEQNVEDALDRVTDLLEMTIDHPPPGASIEKLQVIRYILSRVLVILVHRSDLDDRYIPSVGNFFQSAADIIIQHLSSGKGAALDLLHTILSTDMPLYRTQETYGTDMEHELSAVAAMHRELCISVISLGCIPKLLDKIQNVELECSLSGFRYILQILLCIKGYVDPGKVIDFATVVKQHLPKRLLELPDSDLKQEDKAVFQSLFASFEELTRIINTTTAGEQADALQVQMGLKLLQCQFLEKRIQGLLHIRDVSELALQKQERLLHPDMYRRDRPEERKLILSRISVSNLNQILEEHRIVEYLFGPSKHLELLRRSTDVLSFLLKTDFLKKEHFQLIWESTIGAHESTKTAIYKLMTDLFPYMNDGFMALLLNCAATTSQDSTEQVTLMFVRNLLQTLGQRLYRNSRSKEEFEPTLYQGIEFFWRLIQESSNLTNELRNKVFDYFSQMILSYECFDGVRVDLMKKCIANLTSDNPSLMCTKLLGDIIKDAQASSHRNVTSDSMINLLKQPLSDGRYILDCICEGLSNCRQEYSQSHSLMDADRLLAEPGLLRKRLEDRITMLYSLLSILLQTPGISLLHQHIDAIWNCGICLAEDPREKEKTYHWFQSLKSYSVHPEEHILDDASTNYIFQHKILSLEPELLSLPGYTLFHSFYSCIKEQSKGQAESDETVHLEESGMQLLWRIATECKDEQVGLKALQDLIEAQQVHLHPLEAQSQTDMLVQNSLHALSSSTTLLSIQDTGPEILEKGKLKISRILLLFKILLNQIFKAQLPVLNDLPWKKHGTSSPGQLRVLKVQQTMGNKVQFVSCYFTWTVHELKCKIAEVFDTPISQIRLLTSGRELLDDSLALSETPVTAGMPIVFLTRQNPNVLASPKASEQENFADSSNSTREFPLPVLATDETHRLLLAICSFTEIYRKAWEILMILPTNKSKMEMLEIPSNQMSLANSLDPKNLHEFLYNLQIIDCLLQDPEENSWSKRFRMLGGHRHLLDCLCKVGTHTDIPRELADTCIALILKILNVISLDINYDIASSETLFEAEFLPGISLQVDLDVSIFTNSIQVFIQILSNAAVDTNRTITASSNDADSPQRAEIFYRAILLLWSCITKNDEIRVHILTNELFLDLVGNLFIVCSSKSIRSYFTAFLHNVSTPTDNKLARSLLVNMVTRLQRHFMDVYSAGVSAEQYFELLSKLLKELRQNHSGSDIDDILYHTSGMAQESLQKHISIETRLSDAVDQWLEGILRLLIELLSPLDNKPVYLSQEDQHKLIEHVFVDCLFSVPSEGYIGRHEPPKCKSMMTRGEAFRLLSVLLMLDKKNILVLINLLTAHLKTTEHSRNVWQYQPSLFNRSSTGFVGLKNQGATCYMNSLLQQLFMVPGFIPKILQAPSSYGSSDNADDTETESSDMAPKQDCLLHHLQIMFSNLIESEKKFYDTLDFCQNYRDGTGERVQLGVQMDVVEFFNGLFDSLENQLKGKPQQNALKEHFGGATCNQIISRECDHVSERKEDFYLLSIDVNNKKSIVESLESFVQGEMLEGDNQYFCESCNKKVDALKRCCIQDLPQTLIIHLKRFEFDFESMRRLKLNTFCAFPMELDMYPYTKEGIASHENDATPDKNLSESASSPTTRPKYKLSGVLVHMGTADAGHYYSYIRDRASGDDEKWLLFNDTIVEEVDVKTLEKECFGGTEMVTTYDAYNRPCTRQLPKNYSAYMLLYDREDIVLAPNGREQSHEIIPKDIYQQIWQENSQFLRDLTVFDDEFFSFMWSMATIIESNHESDLFEGNDLELFFTFVTQVMSHAKDKSSFGKWISYLNARMAVSLQAANRILVRLSDPRLLQSILLRCTIAETRNGFVNLVVGCLRAALPADRSFSYQSEGEALSLYCQFVLIYINMFVDVPHYLKSTPQFFMVLQYLTSISHKMRLYLVKNGAMGKMMSTFEVIEDKIADSRQKRARHDGRELFVDTGSFARSISNMIRSISYGSQSESSPYTLSDKTETIPWTSLHDHPSFEMMISFIKENGSSDAISDAFSHMCWKNWKNTTSAFESLMTVTHMNFSESTGLYFAPLIKMCKLDDELQTNRDQLFYRLASEILHKLPKGRVNDQLILNLTKIFRECPSIQALWYKDLEQLAPRLLLDSVEQVRAAAFEFILSFEALSSKLANINVNSIHRKIFFSCADMIESIAQVLVRKDQEYYNIENGSDFSQLFQLLTRTYDGSSAEVDMIVKLKNSICIIWKALCNNSFDVDENRSSWMEFIHNTLEKSPELVLLITESQEFTNVVLKTGWSLDVPDSKQVALSIYLGRLYHITLQCCQRSELFCKLAMEEPYLDSIINYVIFKYPELGETAVSLLALVQYLASHSVHGAEYRRRVVSYQCGGADLKFVSPQVVSNILKYLEAIIQSEADFVHFLTPRHLFRLHKILNELSQIEASQYSDFIDLYIRVLRSLIVVSDQEISAPPESSSNPKLVSNLFEAKARVKNVINMLVRLITQNPVSLVSCSHIIAILADLVRRDQQYALEFLEVWQQIEVDRLNSMSSPQETDSDESTNKWLKQEAISTAVPLHIKFCDARTDDMEDFDIYELVCDAVVATEPSSIEKFASFRLILRSVALLLLVNARFKCTPPRLIRWLKENYTSFHADCFDQAIDSIFIQIVMYILESRDLPHNPADVYTLMNTLLKRREISDGLSSNIGEMLNRWAGAIPEVSIFVLFDAHESYQKNCFFFLAN
eukprot:TRINITY_DN3683_c0_g1_i10.p1 TRINITY_DN3683_c0_g1~~TRINITY_DN3683_c0_g1_i10.p1  ORF type:complete len:2744 (+),score=414.88 TRINITY_DN3683_c0_g1_i10:68-8299(+)